MLGTRYLRWRVLVQTCLIVLGIVAAKLAISALSLEFINISPLFTSVLDEAGIILSLISFFFISLLRLPRMGPRRRRHPSDDRGNLDARLGARGRSAMRDILGSIRIEP
jgi:hypothetical protein